MSETQPDLDPALANHILARMGEAGQPPERGIRHVNVGNEHFLEILRTEYLDRLLIQARGSAFKLVQGYYGGGKTHFLYCVRDLAWEKGFLTALVSLSPQECPYEDPYLVYRAVAGQLAAAPLQAGSEPTRGLPEVLRELAEDTLAKLEPAEREHWLRRTALRIPVDGHTFRRAAAEFLRCVLEEDTEGEVVLEAWLRGDPVPRSEIRRFGLFEVIERSNAFQALRSMCQVLVGYGFPGLVLMFDEADRNLSIPSRRIQALGDNLRQVIDLCGASQLPGVLFLYAVPPEFLRLVVPEYPALDQRLRSPLPMSRHSPQAALIDLEQLSMGAESLLEALGGRLLDVFRAACGWEPTMAIQQGNLQALARASANMTLEIGHRRNFVKTWVAFLHQQRLRGESWLSDEAAEALVVEGFASPAADLDDFSDV